MQTSAHVANLIDRRRRMWSMGAGIVIALPQSDQLAQQWAKAGNLNAGIPLPSNAIVLPPIPPTSLATAVRAVAPAVKASAPTSGMSNGTKIALAVGALGVLGAGAYLLMGGKRRNPRRRRRR